MARDPKVRLTVDVDPETARLLYADAERKGQTVSVWMRRALEVALSLGDKSALGKKAAA
jgi:hypothetical protein